MRCVLVTLLLAVLTLVGGAATANGAAPAALATRSLAPAAVAEAPPSAAPRIHRTGHRTGHDSAPASRHRTCHSGALGSRHQAGHGIAHDVRHQAGHGIAHDVRHLVAQATHEQPRAAADPAQAPRAGTGRAYLLLHAPPPPHDVLTPAPPGPAEPRGGGRQVAEDSFDAPGSRRGALPGVRGPPRRTTGPTTGHPPSCSAVPASRPR
ncbi:hypothetical protein PV702_12580 [Streptomyces sp. FL06-04B]|uniref:hypothetical protein n=1 Tax=Streptomyces TaxID=1883 RepID=UPI0029A89627|nr:MULTISPECIES: hypothetical protein [unclassified Streptomyces]MDX3607267.1 hypothetical protein [Streptomyces sp. FL06-04B]MDX3736519.1 hypothetical protein [Streptomyces sp. ID01-15D]